MNEMDGPGWPMVAEGLFSMVPLADLYFRSHAARIADGLLAASPLQPLLVHC
jgi:hypothetical protein